MKPLTALSRTALSNNVKHLKAADSASGALWVAPATVFISHAWRYKAADIFDAIEAFDQKCQAEDPEM